MTINGVRIRSKKKHIIRQRVSLVIFQSLDLIQPGINAGQPNGLKKAKWIDV